ncbi:GNAT family N-acetyltransferase [Streptomyces sp. NBC_01353]|nr:GNAT family N-acetyltransferase [Streptomyces sp. NBC_01353]
MHRAEPTTPRLPRGVTVRRLRAEDAPALAALDPGMAWIHGSWGVPAPLAASGLGWAAFRKGRILAVAWTRFLGSRYEDIPCATAPDQRRQHLALACVTGLTTDTARRGHRAGWTCSRDNRPSRLLAWTAGFRLSREYVPYVTGPAAVRQGSPPPHRGSVKTLGRTTRSALPSPSWNSPSYRRSTTRPAPSTTRAGPRKHVPPPVSPWCCSPCPSPSRPGTAR